MHKIIENANGITEAIVLSAHHYSSHDDNFTAYDLLEDDQQELSEWIEFTDGIISHITIEAAAINICDLIDKSVQKFALIGDDVPPFLIAHLVKHMIFRKIQPLFLHDGNLI